MTAPDYALKMLVLELVALREDIARKDAQLKVLHEAKDMKNDACYEAAAALGLKGFNIEGVGACTLGQSDYPRITDAEALMTSLRALGAGALIKPTVPPQTLRAFMKERKEQNLPSPEGVEVYTKRYLRIQGMR